MKKIEIAIIDNGINDKLLRNHFIKEIFVDEDNRCKMDNTKIENFDFQHGTICALILEKNYPDCRLNSIRILNKEGEGEIDKREPALEWCYENNVQLINLSLGTTHFRENERLNVIINKYTSKGLIIVAATSNAGFCTYPAMFTNVIGVATIGNPLQYCKDFVHLGIDTVVPSVHKIKLDAKVHKTSLSNSYAAPYVSALVAKKMIEDENCGIHTLKKYVREKSYVDIGDGIYNPDWVYKAYIKNIINDSKADYYFETVTGNYENIEHEVDTVIVCSKTELEQINLGNKNLIYLGNDDIENMHISGFKWSWYTRVRQIVSNQYRGNGLDIPLIILDIADSLDKYFILSKIRQEFEKDGYNAYAISMEPECILYRFEYIPDIYMPLTNQLVTDFIEGQIYYKQSDLVLWNVAREKKMDIYNLYPDCDMEIIFDEVEVLVYIERKLIYKKIYSNLTEEFFRAICGMAVNYLTEEET